MDHQVLLEADLRDQFQERELCSANHIYHMEAACGLGRKYWDHPVEWIRLTIAAAAAMVRNSKPQPRQRWLAGLESAAKCTVTVHIIFNLLWDICFTKKNLIDLL